MTLRSRVVTLLPLPFLLLTATLGVRAAVRELAMPLEGIERLTIAKATAPETPIAEIPELEISMEAPLEPEGETGTMSRLINDPPETMNWDQWKSQAIAALPAELRQDSEHRRAIDYVYLQAIKQTLDELVADTNDRPLAAGYDIGGIGFTDIDEQTAASDLWITLWDEWKEREIASLPEAWRNDPNQLKPIVTTYEEMVKQHRGNATYMVYTLNNVRIEIRVLTDQEATEEFIGTEVDP